MERNYPMLEFGQDSKVKNCEEYHRTFNNHNGQDLGFHFIQKIALSQAQFLLAPC